MDSTFDKIQSSFADFNQEEKGRINFDFAKKLNGGGTTCETYVTRVNGRLVFVKKLKEEYQNKPIYLNAFQKEFEVGGLLRHKSLPVYLDYQPDYISLEYIDGQTLSDMIHKYDPWLIKKENIKHLLEELLDVVAYLHDKNVIHCDIKPDNIMLTYGSHNLFLIDLDKCYTSWFDNTAGSSEKYGLREGSKKTASMDFRGMGRLLETMENSLPGFPGQDFQIFKEECFAADTNLDILHGLLKEIDKIDERNKFRTKFRKNKSREPEPTTVNQKELERIERERRNIENTLIIFDGPLQYRFFKSEKTISVCCHEEARKICNKANIKSPYEVNGEKFYVTEIPMMGFAECINLKSIELPQGITKLYRATFLDCDNLEYVKIPASVQTILGGVFSGCRNLKKLEFENPEGLSISADFLSGSNDNVEIVDLSTGISYTCQDFIAKFGSISK